MMNVAFVCLAVSLATDLCVGLGSGKSNASYVRVSIVNACTGSPPLEVLRRSPTAGYIQTPGLNYRTLHPANMNSVVRVEVPKKHIIMISLLHVNLTEKVAERRPGHRTKPCKCDPYKVTLAVYETSMTRDNIVWQCERMPVQRHKLSRGTNLYVHFHSGKSRKSGFKLFFTVTEISLILQEVGPNMWNCSVANFVDFKPHFPCDLYPQCVHKEDERDCPYFSEECGLGFVTMGNRCLILEKGTGTWRDMEFLCNKRGGTMVNVRTREDHDRLVQYLKPLADFCGIFLLTVGMHSTSKSLPFMYREEFQNSDRTIAFYKSVSVKVNAEILCGYIDQKEDYFIFFKTCFEAKFNRALCDITNMSTTKKNEFPVNIRLQSLTYSNHSLLRQLIRCPRGHVTRKLFACDFKCTCWTSRASNLCSAPLTPLPPQFTCTNGVERVPYTLVCDIRPDCSDGSDETFWVFPPCDIPELFYCRECVPRNTLCDGQRNCHNAADEDLCSEDKLRTSTSPPPPAIVHLSKHGQFTVHKMNPSQLTDLSPAVCPETHFQCPDNGYCMPVYLRCNGVYDCLGKEDEAGCKSYTCPGFYRCRNSPVCVHPGQLCDDIFQCPQNDDELLCDLRCPENCTCYGLAFYCKQPFQERNINNLRFLDAHKSGIKTSDLMDNIMLIFLSVAGNGLTTVGELNFPNLRNLDISDNQLKVFYLHDLNRLPWLETLSLSGNPLQSLFQPVKIYGSKKGMVYSEYINVTSLDVFEQNTVIQSLRLLDLSRTKLTCFNSSCLSLLPNLHTVNMSGGGVETLLGDGFQSLRHLRKLDLRGCPLTYFPRDILLGLEKLETVYSDNMKICCPATLPARFVLKNCHAPSDDLSSCEALLKFNIYRIFLSVFASLALMGNASSFCYRVFVQKRKQLLSFDVFVSHLCISDFLMGVYLSIIGVADRLYQETYLWEDHNWMNSIVCRVAGFLSLVSSEVSALVICLITIDRFLVIRFPLSTFHFRSHSAHIASLGVWVVGCLIAAVPFAPGAASWHFYSQTGICIPLPVSRPDSPGYTYAFGVMIVANFIFFIVIAGGQGFIYFLLHNPFSSNPYSFSDTRKSQDITIARRLITVAMSDFLCWFPIGLAGLLAATGTYITGEVNVAMAIFVLPFNSALNPFLYTLNLALESRRKTVEERLIAQFKSEFTKQLHI